MRPTYKYTCKECGHVSYGDHLKSTKKCDNCRALAFGLQKKEWINYGKETK